MKSTLFIVTSSDLTCAVLDRGDKLSLVSGHFTFDCSMAALRETTQQTLDAVGVSLGEVLEVNIAPFLDETEQPGGGWKYQGVASKHPIEFLRDLVALQPDAVRSLLNENVTAVSGVPETALNLFSRTTACPKPMLSTMPFRGHSSLSGVSRPLAHAA